MHPGDFIFFEIVEQRKRQLFIGQRRKGTRVYNFSGRNIKRSGRRMPIIFFHLMTMFILLLGTTLAWANPTYLESMNVTSEPSRMIVNNLTISNSTELNEIKGVTFATKSRLTCEPKLIQKISGINQKYLLYIFTVLFGLFYLYCLYIIKVEQGKRRQD